MHQLLRGQPLAPLFKPGTVLWRSVSCFSSFNRDSIECRTYDIETKKTERGSYMLKMMHVGGGDFANEPCLYYWKASGINVFVNEEIPEDWTHLVVTGVSKVMKEKYDPLDKRPRTGSVIFAKVATPIPMQEYLRFRAVLANRVCSDLNCDFDKKVEMSSQIWPKGLDSTVCRLVVEAETRYIPNPKPDDVLYNYCHVRLQEAS